MGRKFAAGLLATGMLVATAFADSGLVVKQSPYSVVVTLDRLTTIVQGKGLNVVARVRHSTAASNAGLSLRPTEMLIFGNPKMGTPLMNANQTIGIDLPMRVLAWKDANGKVWVGYYPPADLAARHGVQRPGIIQKMTGALDKLTSAAIAR
ncbi:MAG: DUF302 domain-containing protein [Gammaproteobacteria bacterium]|nr:DUF302 domain-containing protein [Gammaproteobacteria bacterium]